MWKYHVGLLTWYCSIVLLQDCIIVIALKASLHVIILWCHSHSQSGLSY